MLTATAPTAGADSAKLPSQDGGGYPPSERGHKAAGKKWRMARMERLLRRVLAILDRDEVRDAYSGEDSYDDVREAVEALLVERPQTAELRLA